MANIFVIDDSVSVRKALEVALKPHSTRYAISGEDALSKIDDEPFDLMITDIVMPGMSGFELCQKINSDPKYAHIPILVISANINDEVKREAQQAGAREVLRKPFRPEELRPVVQHFLEKNERTTAQPPTQQVQSAPHTVSRAQEPIASAVYDQQGQLLESSGEALPEGIGQYARFYLNTAAVLGQKFDEGLSNVKLEFTQYTVQFELLGSNHISIKLIER